MQVGVSENREALLDSVPPWQLSLWARRRRQRREGGGERREGGREEEERGGEEQDVSVRLGVSCHREERAEEETTAQWRENHIRLGD